MNKNINIKIKEIVENEVGLFLYATAYTKEGYEEVFNVYLYAKDRKISLDECAKAHKKIYPILEEYHITDNYSVQIGSVGIEKPLIEKWHFENAIDELAQIKTKTQGKITGTIKIVQEDIIEVVDKINQVKIINFDDIKSAKTLYKD
jgi:ribosome maturation factor RimP